MDTRMLTELIDRYKSDSESVYNNWFVSSEERMKAFRAIRRGVRDTVDSIAKGTFGTDFKGSRLAVVLTAITGSEKGVGSLYLDYPHVRAHSGNSSLELLACFGFRHRSAATWVSKYL